MNYYPLCRKVTEPNRTIQDKSVALVDALEKETTQMQAEINKLKNLLSRSGCYKTWYGCCSVLFAKKVNGSIAAVNKLTHKKSSLPKLSK